MLVIYSNTRLLPATVEGDRGLRDGLAGGPAPVELNAEFLDVPRFGGSAFVSIFATYLRGQVRGSSARRDPGGRQGRARAGRPTSRTTLPENSHRPFRRLRAGARGACALGGRRHRRPDRLRRGGHDRAGSAPASERAAARRGGGRRSDRRPDARGPRALRGSGSHRVHRRAAHRGTREAPERARPRLGGVQLGLLPGRRGPGVHSARVRGADRACERGAGVRALQHLHRHRSRRRQRAELRGDGPAGGADHPSAARRLRAERDPAPRARADAGRARLAPGPALGDRRGRHPPVRGAPLQGADLLGGVQERRDRGESRSWSSRPR